MANYAIKNLNGWNNVEGKIFLGDELGLTGAQCSLQRLAAGEDAPFFHSHKTHEEIHGKAPIKKYFHGVLAKRGAFCYDRRYSCFVKNYTIFERGRQVL